MRGARGAVIDTVTGRSASSSTFRDTWTVAWMCPCKPWKQQEERSMVTPGRPQEEIGDGRTQKITGFPFSPLLLPEAGLFRANHAVCKSGGMEGGVSHIWLCYCCVAVLFSLLLGSFVGEEACKRPGTQGWRVVKLALPCTALNQSSRTHCTPWATRRCPLSQRCPR